MTKTLQDQRVLIIGGAKFLGEQLARAAARHGAHVIIGARDLPQAETLAKQLPSAEAIPLDVTDEQSIREAAETVEKIEHVVITASAHHNVPVAQLEHDGIVAAFEAKIVGPMLVAKHFTERMPASGSLLLFSGTAAWNPSSGLSVMGVTNGAVAFLASHLAHEIAPIRVNAISPGITDSGTWDDMDQHSRQSMYQGAAENSLAGRIGEPEDIAEAAIWLLGAPYVSGETIHVDGGSRHA